MRALSTGFGRDWQVLSSHEKAFMNVTECGLTSNYFRYIDLSGVPGFCEVLLQQLESQQDFVCLVDCAVLVCLRQTIASG